MAKLGKTALLALSVISSTEHAGHTAYFSSKPAEPGMAGVPSEIIAHNKRVKGAFGVRVPYTTMNGLITKGLISVDGSIPQGYLPTGKFEKYDTYAAVKLTAKGKAAVKIKHPKALAAVVDMVSSKGEVYHRSALTIDQFGSGLLTKIPGPIVAAMKQPHSHRVTWLHATARMKVAPYLKGPAKSLLGSLNKSAKPAGNLPGDYVNVKVVGGDHNPLATGLDSKGRMRYQLHPPKGKTAREVAREIKKSYQSGAGIFGGKIYVIRLVSGGKEYDYYKVK